MTYPKRSTNAHSTKKYVATNQYTIIVASRLSSSNVP
jgi:hypothetical protein